MRSSVRSGSDVPVPAPFFLRQFCETFAAEHCIAEEGADRFGRLFLPPLVEIRGVAHGQFKAQFARIGGIGENFRQPLPVHRPVKRRLMEVAAAVVVVQMQRGEPVPE